MRRRDRVAVVALAWLGQVLGWFAGRRMWRGTEPGVRALIAARQLTASPGTVFDEVHYVRDPRMLAAIKRAFAESVAADELAFRRERLNQWIEPDA